MKKLFLFALSSVVLFSVSSVEAAYPEVECSTDGVYSQYSCNQCFNGGEIKNSAVISFLDDIWLNETDNQKIMFKEEQSLPKMNALNGATFEQNPSVDEDFWEYTSELDTLYSEEYAGYVLNPGQEVSWLKSTLGSGYKANIGENVKGTNVGLLVFDLMSHNILPNGEFAMNSRPHKECVLFKSAQAEAPVVEVVVTPTPDPTPEPTPEQMTQVQTGPELYFVVLMLSFLLAMVWSKRQVLFARK